VRRAALEILLRVEHRGAYADVLLGNQAPEFEDNDRRLLTLLVLGTLAWRARLDFELAQLASRALEQIDPVVLEILRLGLFQLRFLDRVPRHAAVDTAVTLANSDRRARNASGFINAVLRKATRTPSAEPAGDDLGSLAIRWSHPLWLAERFVAMFGREVAERLMAADNEAAPTAIRLNPSRGTREEIVARIKSAGMEIASQSRFAETVILRGAPRFDSAAFRDGFFHVQSEASQLVARILGPGRGATVADCAAAPGGKATHLAELIGERGSVVALDLNFAGLRTAREIARRLGHDNIIFARGDAAAAPPLRPASFEFVLLDAPCTGTGTLREHPEIRWRVRPEDPVRMAALQRAMLAGGAELVRPGGAIVYSVCSLMREEGADVIADFLRRHPEFTIDPRPPGFQQLRDLIREDGTMLTRPDRGGLDGFFAARLIRHA
jgi:16S rRNA (cytosine967-C5)-methyltransferase